MKTINVILCMLALALTAGNVNAATITVCSSGCDSTTIQGGIDIAYSGDTINIAAGNYTEKVIINKSVNLEGLGAIVTGIIHKDVFHITADNVNISGFSITGGHYGIYILEANHSHIYNNNFYSTKRGISLESSNNNIITNNSFISTMDGVYLVYSSNNTISNNVANSNGEGIFMDSDTNYNIITNNTISNSANDAIILCGASYNYIENNDIISNVQGFWITCTPSDGNIIVNNNILNSDTEGLYIEDKFDNGIITNNNISNNHVGIFIGSLGASPENNQIYHNIFINNTIQVKGSGSNNSWDNGYPDGGNYWDDYTGIDADGDLIGDTPHIIDGNKDNHPLMVPLVSEVDFKNQQILGLKKTTDNISMNFNSFEENMNVFFPGFYLQGYTLKEQVSNFVDSVNSLSEICKQSIDNFLGNPRYPMHVEDISFANITKGKTETLQIPVSILFENDLNVADATVDGILTLPDLTTQSYSGNTNISGHVIFEYEQKNQLLQSGNYSFCVDNVIKPGIIYDNAQNIETCDIFLK
ncbi:MAG: right-handed parallel beta-helix repeat-containing protein [Spirochaetes bacterium]|nr:right-handed parallel beta-helix repeat-containing protein [Spirochaetota bacterium]